MSTSLKLTTVTQEERNNNNKRPAPSQARLDKLKQLKKGINDEKSASISLQSDTTETPVKQNLIRETAPDFTDMDTEVSMWKRRNGETIPKLHLQGDGRMKKFLFSLPAMRVKWQQLGKEGNMNRRIGKSVITDINKARITASLENGCPDDLASVFPDLVDQQENFQAHLLLKCKEHMESAFLQDEDPSWDRFKAGKEMEDFVEKANFSCIKPQTDENGDEYTVVNVTRRVVDFQGNPNECKFWKSNEKSEYEQIEPKYIRKGSLIRCMGSLRAYKTPNMYGVSLDLERDIVVVWMPPLEDRSQQKTEEPAIPFLNFTY